MQQSCFTVVTPDYRGKGEYYRLGTDSSTLVKEPQQIETLTKKIVQVSVGSLHCLALTDSGEVRTEINRYERKTSVFKLVSNFPVYIGDIHSN